MGTFNNSGNLRQMNQLSEFYCIRFQVQIEGPFFSHYNLESSNKLINLQ